RAPDGAAGLAHEQPGEDRRGADERPERVRVRRGHFRRRAVGTAGEFGEAGERLKIRPEGYVGAVLPGRTERRHRHVDEVRIGGVQHVPAKPPVLHRRSAEVLDDDIRLGDEAQERIAPRRSSEVETDEPLTHVEAVPPATLSWKWLGDVIHGY